MTTKIPVELSSTPGIVDGSNATAITIDSSENVGIGTTSPSSRLETVGGDGITISNSGDTFLQLKTTGTTATNYIEFKDSGGSAGNISYNHTDNYLATKVNGSERMRINSSGTVLIGLTTASGIANSSGTGNEGAMIQQDGLIISSISNESNMVLNRKTSQGVQIQFRYNGSNVGSISTNSNSLPSDRNFKRDIEDLNIGLDLVSKLNPVSYNYKIDNDGTPKMYGLIAQDLEQSLEEVGVDKNSVQLLQHKPTDDEKESDYSLDYLKLTPILIKAIQEQQTVIEDLKSRITTLEG